MMKNICFGFLFGLLSVTGIQAQDQASATIGSGRMSFSSLSPNPFQNQFTFRPEADGKIVIFNSEGMRIEERHFSKNEVLEMGNSWPKGSYHIKVFGADRTDFTKVRKE